LSEESWCRRSQGHNRDSSNSSDSSAEAAVGSGYVVTSGLGMGGFSIVVLAEEVASGLQFAMKVHEKGTRFLFPRAHGMLRTSRGHGACGGLHHPPPFF
jgi:hypothetical protein